MIQYSLGCMCLFELWDVFCFFFFSRFMPRSGIAGSYESSVFNFLRNFHTVLHTNLHFYQQSVGVGGVPFSTSSSAFIVCRFFDNDHLDQCELIPHCSFDFHFSNNKWCWASFHMPLGHLYVFFGEMSIYIFCPFFDWVVCGDGGCCYCCLFSFL